VAGLAASPPQDRDRRKPRAQLRPLLPLPPGDARTELRPPPCPGADIIF
jgi:hypothetical protein